MSNKDKGYIALHRKVKDNWIWNCDPINRFQAWMDILMLANHKDAEISFNKHPLKIERGSFVTSVAKLAREWGWSKNKTLSFLRDLEKSQMITRKSNNNGTTVFVNNYADYQPFFKEKKYTDESTDRPTDRPTDESTDESTDRPQTIMNNNDNNEKEDVLPDEPNGYQEEYNEWFENLVDERELREEQKGHDE